jgi:HAD superfamily hydrolase (TIGR01549 family)
MALRALLFDYGGTLDGAGSHWLDRFLAFYREAGLDLSFEQFRGAFDHATRCAYADPQVAALDLEATVDFHIRHHLEFLDLTTTDVAARVRRAFVTQCRRDLEESRRILERLRQRASLGVISNFYGNLERLLRDAGIAPLLAVIVDSARVGVSKPDPAIFALALQRLGCLPQEAMYVGDSFDKDMVGAHAAGLRTAWLVGTVERSCANPAIVDVRLRRLADLESVLA